MPHVIAFMLVLVISGGTDRTVMSTSGFDKDHCLTTRDWIRRKGFYRDEHGTYRLESAQCVREYINVT